MLLLIGKMMIWGYKIPKIDLLLKWIKYIQVLYPQDISKWKNSPTDLERYPYWKRVTEDLPSGKRTRLIG